jgi:type II secretory pathway component PulF
MPAAARVRLLGEMSAIYNDRAARRLSWTHGAAAPLAICLIGVVVGFAVIGLFLPLVQLINSLSG